MTSRAILFAITGAMAFTLLGLRDSATDLTLARLAVAGGALAAAAVIDLREHRVPNPDHPSSCNGCGGARWHRSSAQSSGSCACGLLLSLAIQLPNLDALDMGDIKTALLIALALGVAALPALMIGLVLTAAAREALVVRHGSIALTMVLPVAPFLAVGAALAVAVT
jgi:hypothetical protein